MVGLQLGGCASVVFSLIVKSQRGLVFRVAARKLPTDLLENGASILGHRDATVVLKFYGKHIDQRADHLRGLVEATSQPSTPESKKGKPAPQQEDENPHGLKVIGKVPPSEPEPKSKRRKRDAG
jgi:hypothetical protein